MSGELGFGQVCFFKSAGQGIFLHPLPSGATLQDTLSVSKKESRPFVSLSSGITLVGKVRKIPGGITREPGMACLCHWAEDEGVLESLHPIYAFTGPTTLVQNGGEMQPASKF